MLVVNEDSEGHKTLASPSRVYRSKIDEISSIFMDGGGQAVIKNAEIRRKNDEV